MVKYKCIAQCPENDDDNLNHCVATAEEIEQREEMYCDYCPCGNNEIWEEIEDKNCTE